jgi:Flp pilus assembly pilin Flp
MASASRARAFLRSCVRFFVEERGATSIEYAMIAVGIACAVAATVFSVGNSLNTNYWAKVNANLQN